MSNRNKRKRINDLLAKRAIFMDEKGKYILHPKAVDEVVQELVKEMGEEKVKRLLETQNGF
jgi:hypothetical protein